ncbi:MAG: hypothetical protein RI538_09440 [Salibaculum sp.]|jgi:heme exporter protein D|uniref:hypothetical protein n=1 Tax=Roseovarius halophilus (ex Wu et al. 2025) TaxID=3376060 RepID=UPI0028705390|nr:hypothetical protein [Salibaculum sp.]MDR9428593.1 hypothetical protein [Salibaculum sp.]MDR9482985.1 hypothetical protein [Salibaculum sp.]
MQTLVWIGAALSLLGLAGIIASIVKVQRARRAGLSDEDLRARIQKALPLNLGAFMLSALGLGCVVVGVLLG